MSRSIPEIVENIIEWNSKHGIVCRDRSGPKLLRNRINGNKEFGLILHSGCLAYLVDNAFIGEGRLAILKMTRVKNTSLRKKINEKEEAVAKEKARRQISANSVGIFESSRQDSFYWMKYELEKMKKDLSIWEMSRLESDNEISGKVRMPSKSSCALI